MLDKQVNLCRDCGYPIIGKRHNALYCDLCAEIRKREQDHAAWVKRNNKKKMAELKSPEYLREKAEKNLYKQHASELGIDISYYELWKNCHPDVYKKWMDEHLGKFEE